MIVIVVAVMPACLLAQASQGMSTSETRKYPSDRDSTKPGVAISAKDRQLYGRNILDLAEADSKGLQGGMRAYALLKVAQCYASNDKKKTLELLDNAFTATQEMDEDSLNTRANLQQRILRAMVPLAPEHVDELLPYVDVEKRAQIVSTLLDFYEKNNQLDRAAETIIRVSQETEFPYSPAANVMEHLPEDQAALFTQLFTAAVASYREHAPHPIVTERPSPNQNGSLSILIVAFWQRLPPEFVKEAISEMLKQAQPPDPLTKSDDATISMASSKGSVSLSHYEFLLFELLPILRQLDERQAERLLKENQSVSGVLAKYPKGVESLKNPEGGISGYSAGTPDARTVAFTEAEARIARIVADADKHPRDALATALVLQNKNERARALDQIAQSVWKKNEAVTKEVLRALADQLPDLNDDQQAAMYLEGAARFYIAINDTDSVTQIVDKGFKAASRLYKIDTNADDPNTTLKAYWPSTDAYSRFLRIAGEVSPASAFAALKEIPDPEIRALAEAALAGAWLGVPIGETVVAFQGKKGARVTTTIMQ
jgi:hypothetical protein